MNRVQKSIDENPGCSPQQIIEAYAEALERAGDEMSPTAEELEVFIDVRRH